MLFENIIKENKSCPDICRGAFAVHVPAVNCIFRVNRVLMDK
jgi:hypothetical protein